MKITLQKIVQYEFYTDAERSRINKVFDGGVRDRQLKLLELFEQGKFTEALEFADGLGYDGDDPEVEYVSEGMLDLIQTGAAFELRKKTKADRKNCRDCAEVYVNFSIIKKA